VKYVVTSDRLDWPEGSVLTTRDLAGCNIAVLTEVGHLAPHVEHSKSKKLPVTPALQPDPEPVDEQESFDA
jgi:hypothetical protein